MSIVNTAIFIQAPVDIKELFNTLLRQVLFYHGKGTAPGDVDLMVGTRFGLEYIATDLHENLPCMSTVWYKDEGPVISKGDSKDGWVRVCGNPECEGHQAPECHVIVAFGSSAFYTDERGWNAGNLHSGLIYAIGGFLDVQKIPWLWQESLTSSTHEGYEDLDAFGSAVGRMRDQVANPLGMAQMVSREILRAMGFTQDEE